MAAEANTPNHRWYKKRYHVAAKPNEVSKTVLSADLIARMETKITQLEILDPLFSANEQGYVYDLNDVTTLFKDTAGTVPVTAAGDAVALRLDKSRGLALGTELVTNGDFSSGLTGWTLTGGWVVSGGTASNPAVAGSITQTTGTLTVGKFYRAEWDSANTSPINAVFGGNFVSVGSQRVGRNVVYGFCTGTTTFALQGGSTYAGIDNISVRELAGNHATQATTASRPLYALLPANGVRNLANGSADVGNATFWPAAPVQNGITATKVGSGFDTDGLPYVDVRYQGTASGTSHDSSFTSAQTRTAAVVAEQWTASVIAARTGGSAAGVTGLRVVAIEETAPFTFVNASSSANTTATPETTLSATRTIASGNQIRSVIALDFTNLATIDVTYRIKGLQLELGATRTAYQFNYAATNIAEPPFAQVGALLYDGVNDFMVTPAINFAGAEVLGTELVSNGTFDINSAGWAATAGATLSVSAGEFTITNGSVGSNGGAALSFSTVVGRAYSVRGQVVRSAGGAVVSVDFHIGTAADGFTIVANGALSPSSGRVFIATATTTFITLLVGGNTLGASKTFDNISVKEVITPADEVFLCHGVRKTSDAARGTLVELTTGTAGRFSINAPISAGANYEFGSVGTVGVGAFASGFAAPETAVLSGQAKISTDNALLRRNGTQIATVATDQGTGNYSNAPLYFGSRGGTTFFFKGYEFSSICRGAIPSAARIAQAEDWVRQRTAGAY